MIDWWSSGQEEAKNVNIKEGTKNRQAEKKEGRSGDPKRAKITILTALENLETNVKLSLSKP